MKLELTIDSPDEILAVLEALDQFVTNYCDCDDLDEPDEDCCECHGGTVKQAKTVLDRLNAQLAALAGDRPEEFTIVG